MSNTKPLISKGITIRDVAEKAGVSISLVSFVLNARRGPNGEYLCSASQETARRIVSAAKELGYHSNKAATNLRSGRTDTIGIIVSDISNNCFADICRKVENLAFEAGYLSIFGSSDDKEDKFAQLAGKFLYSGVDGMIVAGIEKSEDLIRNFIDRGIPVVLIDRKMPNLSDVGRVILNNEKAGELAAAHLVRKGCRHIMLVRYETSLSTLLEREKGYVRQIKSSGLEPWVEIVSRDTIDYAIESVIRMGVEEGADGIVLPSNVLTIAGVSAVNRMGLRIPEDIQVVGFDQENCRGVFNPAISFLDQPTKLVAERSFKMLDAAIKDNGPLTTEILNPLFYQGK